MHKSILFSVFLKFHNQYKLFYDNARIRLKIDYFALNPSNDIKNMMDTLLKKQSQIFFNKIDTYNILENSTADDFNKVLSYKCTSNFDVWQHFVYPLIFNQDILKEEKRCHIFIQNHYILTDEVKSAAIINLLCLYNKINQPDHIRYNLYVLKNGLKENFFTYMISKIINRTIFDGTVESQLITKNVYPIYENLKNIPIVQIDSHMSETLFVLYEVDPGYFNTNMSVDQFKDMYTTCSALGYTLGDFFEQIKNYNEIKMLEIQETNIL